MNKITEILKAAGVFFVATAEGDQPRVRPFGAAAEFEGRTYLCTSNTKDCYAQMMKDPKVEISAMVGEGEWIRVTGELIRDDRDEARAAMLRDYPELSGMYRIGDGIFEVLYLKNPIGVLFSFTAAPVSLD